MDHRRKSIRLKDYDYSSQGRYYLTICTKDRVCLFGEVIPAVACSTSPITPRLELNEFGEIVKDAWLDLINHNEGIALGPFVVMPNHIHGIIHINAGAGSTMAGSVGDIVGAGSEPAPTTITHTRVALSEIVRQLKTFSAMRINKQRNTPGVPVWQRNYYEHIIRNTKDYVQIARYILDNPNNWTKDDELIP